MNRLRIALATLLVSLCGAGVRGDDRFAFVIPGDDATPSTTDMSGISPGPVKANGFVRIQDGHFYTDAGRLRIWGFNVCFGGNFPTHEEAEKVAAHLAKLGVNGVRFHHHDMFEAPGGIWGKVVDGKRQLDPGQLDRQDYFLDQLHKRGIYANLNLHVSRTLREAEGFLSEDLPRAVRYNKYMLYFEPGMREALKDFCRAYLLHKNPYRGLRRVDDPGIAMLEITNENKFSTQGPSVVASLPTRYRDEFKGQWNAWLKKEYVSTSALRKRWQEGGEPLGEVLVDGTGLARTVEGWSLNDDVGSSVHAVFGQPGPNADTTALKLDIVKKAGARHHQELIKAGLSLEEGRVYTLSYYARAEKERTLYVDVSNQGPDNWRSLGYGETVRFMPEWQKIERVFRARESVDGNARVCLKFGGEDGDLYLAGLKFQRGGTYKTLPEGQSIEAGNIEIPVKGWSEEAQEDVTRFMVDTEKGFITDVTRFLKDELGARVPITCSQIDYHGARVVAETCDYADAHTYWAHPRFPGRPWDRSDWYLRNEPMENFPGEASILNRAPWRLLDRPFTLSEWNIPSPHDYAGSVVPFAAMVASLQDWDGVFFFTYHSSSDHWFGNGMSEFFSFNAEPVKQALFASFAGMYLRGDLRPLEQTLAGTCEQRLPLTLALSHRIGIDPERTEGMDATAPDGRLASPDESVAWDVPDGKGVVTVNTPGTRAVWGLIAGSSFDLGGLQIKVGPVDRDYAVIVLTSLDGKPLETAKRLLLTATGSAENPGMGWNEERNSVSNRWGKGPTQVNGIPATLTLGSRVRKILALDEQGLSKGVLPVQTSGGATTWSIGPEYKTLWYEVVLQ